MSEQFEEPDDEGTEHYALHRPRPRRVPEMGPHGIELFPRPPFVHHFEARRNGSCALCYGPYNRGANVAGHTRDGKTWWLAHSTCATDAGIPTFAKARSEGIASNPSVKLDEDKVREIRRRAAEGTARATLAAEYGVKGGTIKQIVSRKSWAWVE
jgi:hypothetical protein